MKFEGYTVDLKAKPLLIWMLILGYNNCQNSYEGNLSQAATTEILIPYA